MFERVRRGVRPWDAVLTLVLCSLAALLAWVNVTSSSPALQSQSWWMVPVATAAAVPVLWWRRGPVAMTGISTGIMAVHLLAFGWVVRCGSGLPLAFALAALCGTVVASGTALVGLALAVLLTTLVLVEDVAAGPALIPVAIVMCLFLWGIGRALGDRGRLIAELGRRSEELRELRARRAAVEVTSDRAHLSHDVEVLLATRLGELSAMAEAALASGSSYDPATARALFSRIETESRDTLHRLRELMGRLRGGESDVAPTPGIAQLDSLLGTGSGRLRVAGDPRLLPPSVELSVYRIVEHLVGALHPTPTDAVDVLLGFLPQAVEVSVAGGVRRQADVRLAVSRSRQRAALHAGSLEAHLTRDRAEVVALLPAPLSA